MLILVHKECHKPPTKCDCPASLTRPTQLIHPKKLKAEAS